MTLCYKCDSTAPDVKLVKCCLCSRFAHTKCIGMSGLKYENIAQVRYLCDACFDEVSSLKNLICDIAEIKKDLKNVTAKADRMTNALDEKLLSFDDIRKKVTEATSELVAVADVLNVDESGTTSWAEVVKRRSKRSRPVSTSVVAGDVETTNTMTLNQNLDQNAQVQKSVDRDSSWKKEILVPDSNERNKHAPVQKPNDREPYKRKKMLSGVAKAAMLPTVSRLRHASVFVTRFSSDVTSEDVVTHLSKTLSIRADDISVEKLTARHSSYSSFHVTCYCVEPNVFFDPVIWPEGCFFRRWRSAARQHTQPQVQRPAQLRDQRQSMQHGQERSVRQGQQQSLQQEQLQIQRPAQQHDQHPAQQQQCQQGSDV